MGSLECPSPQAMLSDNHWDWLQWLWITDKVNLDLDGEAPKKIDPASKMILCVMKTQQEEHSGGVIKGATPLTAGVSVEEAFRKKRGRRNHTTSDEQKKSGPVTVYIFTFRCGKSNSVRNFQPSKISFLFLIFVEKCWTLSQYSHLARLLTVYSRDIKGHQRDYGGSSLFLLTSRVFLHLNKVNYEGVPRQRRGLLWRGLHSQLLWNQKTGMQWFVIIIVVTSVCPSVYLLTMSMCSAVYLHVRTDPGKHPSLWPVASSHVPSSQGGGGACSFARRYFSDAPYLCSWLFTGLYGAIAGTSCIVYLWLVIIKLFPNYFFTISSH